jgi:hypothetical protein
VTRPRPAPGPLGGEHWPRTRPGPRAHLLLAGGVTDRANAKAGRSSRQCARQDSNLRPLRPQGRKPVTTRDDKRARTRSTMWVSGLTGRARPHGYSSRFSDVWATSGPRACRRSRQQQQGATTTAPSTGTSCRRIPRARSATDSTPRPEAAVPPPCRHRSTPATFSFARCVQTPRRA